MKQHLLSTALLLTITPTSAISQATVGGDGHVSLFEQTCLVKGTSVSDILRAASETGRWTESDTSGVNIAAVGEAIDVPFKRVAFKKPSMLSHRINADGAHLIVAEYPGKNATYRGVCAVAVTGVQNFFPYKDAFQAAVKRHQPKLSLRNSDVPHLLQMEGKTAYGERAWAELFSRSSVLGRPKTMIMYIAFR